MDEMFTSICRQQVIGRAHHLDEAVRLARERASEEWQDIVIWKGTEVVVIVTAGGEVHVPNGTWTTLSIEDAGPCPEFSQN